MCFTIYAASGNDDVWVYEVTTNASYLEVEAASQSGNFAQWVLTNGTITSLSFCSVSGGELLERFAHTLFGDFGCTMSTYVTLSEKEAEPLPKE